MKSKLLELSDRDREELAFFLLKSLGDEWGPDDAEEWVAELERRVTEYKEDPSVGIPGDEAFARLRKKYS
jgi:putative addiction module component (TIGR02574 family)